MTAQVVTMPFVLQIIFGGIGIVNVYTIFALNRKAKKDDEHDVCHKDLDRRISALETSAMTEEKLRKVIREELIDFELRLINDGRVEPKNKKKQS